MTTICSSCGRELDETENENDFISCKICIKCTPRGCNSYKSKGGEKKMSDKEKDLTKYVQCTICKNFMWTNPQAMKRRIEKFGSEEKMRAGYVCRKCKQNQEEKKE